MWKIKRAYAPTREIRSSVRLYRAENLIDKFDALIWSASDLSKVLRGIASVEGDFNIVLDYTYIVFQQKYM